MIITDALDRFLVQLEADGRSPHTVGQYRRHVRLLVSWLTGEKHSGEITEISHEVLARFLASPMAKTRPDGKTKRATSANCLRSSLRTFFQYIHRAGYAPVNAAAVIKRAICGSPPPRSMSQEDQERFLAAMAAAEGPEAERDYLLFHLMLASGIRLGSALGIERRDVDLDRGEITIRTAKGDRPETIILCVGIQDHLRRYLATRPDVPLFTRRDGHYLTPRHVARRFREWIGKAGIKKSYSPHSLRHSLAMNLYARTKDLLIVKAALRHRSISSTLIYARTDVEQLRKALG